jgi:chaperonin GroEL
MMTNHPIPGVVFQPDAQQAMQRGIHKLATLISPTLGPLPRTVAYQKHSAIELLDKGAIIARRMTDLPNRQEDVGAMYLRHMIWQLYEDVGDGTATATVLFKTLYDEGLRYLAAGASSGKLRSHLEQALKEILEHLTLQTRHVISEAQLKGIAKSVCTDDKLAEVLGATINILGEFGKLELRKGGSDHQWTFVEGHYWAGGVLSKRFLEGVANSRLELEDVGILVTDFDLVEPRDLPPILKTAIAAGFSKLVIVAKTISEPVVTFFKSPQLISQIEVIAVKQNGFTQAQNSANQTDLNTLVGGYPVVSLGQKQLPRVKPDDFGKARLLWADQHHVGIIGGAGDTLKRRKHVEALTNAFRKSEDAEIRKVLRQRLGTLLGGAITLWVGGTSQRDIERNRESAEHADVTVRSALEQGVLAGGGTAFLHCRTLLCSNLTKAETFEERAAYKMLLKAIEAPLRTMLYNAGLEPAEVLANLQHVSDNVGFDIRNNEVVNMFGAGILDVASVQKAALRYAVKSVGLALTTEAVVHKKNPEQVTTP